MLVGWSLAALLIAATLALLLRPLLRARHVAAAPDTDAAAISVYRDQKQALDAECVDGVITPAERDAAVTELARRLGDEVIAVRSAMTDPRVQRRAWVARSPASRLRWRNARWRSIRITARHWRWRQRRHWSRAISTAR